MAPKQSASNKMLSMKLLVNSKTQRVLYAEAGKDVVDFLFSLLTLPVGMVVKLTTGMQQYADGFRPSASRSLPSAYDTPRAAVGVSPQRRPPSAEAC
jgi:hypothetical protein